MRHITQVLAIAALAMSAGVTVRTTADEPKEKAKHRIVPVMVLKPGETKELALSSSLEPNRGQRLQLREMGASHQDAKTEWSGNGVNASIVEVKWWGDEPDPLKRANLKLIVVRVTASKDAKPQLKELHVADETCAGHCDADFRIVVTTP